MKRPVFKRFLAYVLDVIIVALFSSLFISIDKFNPANEEYDTTYQNYMEYVENLEDPTTILTDDTINNFTYDLAYYSRYTSLITLIITIIYFAIFPYFNDGKTIGKALFKMKVVDKNRSKLKFYQVFFRSCIINSIFISIANVIVIFTINKSSYMKASYAIELIDLGLLLISIIMILFREDARGLHDMIFKTEVVSYDELEDEEDVKEAKVIEEKSSEPKEVKKQTTTKKKVTKEGNKDENRNS